MPRPLFRPELRAERRHWLLALAFTAVASIAWSLLVTPDAISARGPVPETVRVSYRPVLLQGEAMGDNLQAVWSPVLFSLPTHVGFSRDMLASSSSMLPPVQHPEESFLMTSAPPRLIREAGTNLNLNTRMQVKRALTRRRMRDFTPDPADLFNDAKNVPGILARIETGPDNDRFVAQPLEISAAETMRDGLFRVTLAEPGFVESVFVEVSSGNVQWDAEVVRELRKWRAQPAGKTESGLVRVSVSARAEADDAEVQP
jgi:hypothetical protein